MMGGLRVRVNIETDEFRVLISSAGTICMHVSYVPPGIRYDCLPTPVLIMAPR
jgi:hypothetical protein